MSSLITSILGNGLLENKSTESRSPPREIPKPTPPPGPLPTPMNQSYVPRAQSSQVSSMPHVLRSTSNSHSHSHSSRPASSSSSSSSEWRSYVAIEERTSIRNKVREGYRKHCPSYESLLDMVAALDEELLFAHSQSRLEYFKTAIDWENRVQVKRKQMSGLGLSSILSSASTNQDGKESSPKRKNVKAEIDLYDDAEDEHNAQNESDDAQAKKKARISVEPR